MRYASPHLGGLVCNRMNVRIEQTSGSIDRKIKKDEPVLMIGRFKLKILMSHWSEFTQNKKSFYSH